MKILSLRSALAASMLTLLTACGGADQQVDASLQAAAAMPAVSVAAQPPANTGAMPVPDCQPENCAGLRIIDGNAEAYRFDAMRRAAAEAKG